MARKAGRWSVSRGPGPMQSPRLAFYCVLSRENWASRAPGVVSPLRRDANCAK